MYKIAASILGFFLIFSTAYAAPSGSIDGTDKYAWSENLGWINFAPPMGNVVVGDGELSGYVWSETAGWITLHPSASVFVHNSTSGVLSGYAWGEATGYIDFNGVTIDEEGYFHGYALSDVTGRISFNCENTDSCTSGDFKVRTSWRGDGSVPYQPEIAKESGIQRFFKQGVGVVQETIAAVLPQNFPFFGKENIYYEKETGVATPLRAPAAEIRWPAFPWMLFGVLLGIFLLCSGWILFQYVKRKRRRSVPYSYRSTKPRKKKMRW